MSNFDVSLAVEGDEKKHRHFFNNNGPQEGRLQDYVKAVNSIREAKGLKPVDARFLIPDLLQKGIDTELAELPDYITKKIRKKRTKKDDSDAGQDSSEGEADTMPMAAE